MSESDSKFHILFKIWCFILGLVLLATGVLHCRWWKTSITRRFLVFPYLRTVYNHFGN